MPYPPIEPHLADHLDVGQGHRVWFDVSGHPNGAPVVFLHGGPGSSTKPDHRRYFDPAFFRIVLFDQRGCGRSTPAGGLVANTTAHLVADMERLRAHLGIDRWMLFGGSWGSTLALAYAQTHPERVTRLVLRGLFLASRDELDWYFDGLRQFLPDAWERLRAFAPGKPWTALVQHFHDAVRGDGAEALAAAAAWNAWESAVMSIGEPNAVPPATTGDAASLARARVQIHYLAHDSFLADGKLLRDLDRIAHLPATLLHGAMDFVCPPRTAWRIAQAWPAATLQWVATAKHASSHPDYERALVAAADAARDALRGGADAAAASEGVE
jgi:proline iminopeptidase